MSAEGGSANRSERVATRVAGGGEEGSVAETAGLRGLLDEGKRSGGDGGRGGGTRGGCGCDGRSSARRSYQVVGGCVVRV